MEVSTILQVSSVAEFTGDTRNLKQNDKAGLWIGYKDDERNFKE